MALIRNNVVSLVYEHIFCKIYIFLSSPIYLNPLR